MDLPRGFGAFLSTLAALLWALGFAVWAFAGAAFMECVNADCGTAPLARFEADQIALVLIPAAVCLAMWALLRAYCSRGSRTARGAASVLVGISVAFSIVSGFSIGLLILPMALLLWLALVLTPPPPARE